MCVFICICLLDVMRYSVLCGEEDMLVKRIALGGNFSDCRSCCRFVLTFPLDNSLTLTVLAYNAILWAFVLAFPGDRCRCR
jgi:hypothetical protein